MLDNSRLKSFYLNRQDRCGGQKSFDVQVDMIVSWHKRVCLDSGKANEFRASKLLEAQWEKDKKWLVRK